MSFISATKKLKSPIVITQLVEAQHLDRKERIKNIELHILSVWNEMFYPKYCGKYTKLNFDSSSNFFAQIKDLKEERDYLISLKSDIINDDIGGVIYCGETNTWAEIC